MADAPIVATRKISRDQLATFLKSHELIKAFENLAKDVSETIPESIQEDRTDIEFTTIDSLLSNRAGENAEIAKQLAEIKSQIDEAPAKIAELKKEIEELRQLLTFPDPAERSASAVDELSRQIAMMPDHGPLLAETRKSLFGAVGTAGSVNFLNKFTNPAMAVDQRNAGAAQTITAAAALAYTVDCWYAYCTGANVTGQRVAGSGSAQYRYQFTGAASVSAIGFGQRIEAANAYPLAGQTATLSVDLANSLLTTVSWAAYYANTADTFGTLASPTRTSIASGTFTVNSTVKNYSAQFDIPAAATTGIEVVFTVGAQTSGTWTIGKAQLQAGSVVARFEERPIALEKILCRYRGRPMTGSAAGQAFTAAIGTVYYHLDTPMRTTPTLSTTSGFLVITGNGTGVSATPAINSLKDESILRIDFSGASLLVAGDATGLFPPAGVFLSAEL